MKRFLRKSQLSIPEELRRLIKAGLKNEVSLNSNIYDSMQQYVESTIRDNIYPSFLCSEMYILYIQQMSVSHERFGSGTAGSGSGSSSGASCGSSGAGIATGGPCVLPTSSGKTASSSVAAFINLPITASGSNVPLGGACSASGSVYGPSTSASSSGSVSATDTLPRSSTLPTLHEDSELSLCDDFEKLRVEGNRIADMPIRLTHDLLLATQKRRLEIRPPG